VVVGRDGAAREAAGRIFLAGHGDLDRGLAVVPFGVVNVECVELGPEESVIIDTIELVVENNGIVVEGGGL